MSNLTEWMNKQEKINIEAANAIKELEKKLEFVTQRTVTIRCKACWYHLQDPVDIWGARCENEYCSNAGKTLKEMYDAK